MLFRSLDPDKIKSTLQKCKEEWGDSVLISSNFIIGLPEEPIESILDTIYYLESEDCPIDVFELNLLSIKPSKDGQVGNIIGDNLEKYGYSMTDEKTWESNLMSYKEAKDFHTTLLDRPVIKNKRKFSSATYIGRILSLGYTIKDVFDILHNKNYYETLIDIRLKGNLLKEEYYKKLMSL